MQSQIRSNSSRVACAIVLAIFGVTGFGCRRQPTRPANVGNQNLAASNTVLTKVGRFAEDSFYSCLLNGYTQGLSPAQARDECATKLLEDDKKGFGGSIGNLRPGSESFFDPSKITRACNSGDPTRGQTSGQKNTPGWGSNTWGPESNRSNGLSQKASDQQKADAIAHAENEMKKFDELVTKELEAKKALDEAKKTGDAAEAAKAAAAQKAAYQAALDQLEKAKIAEEKAKGDPTKNRCRIPVQWTAIHRVNKHSMPRVNCCVNATARSGKTSAVSSYRQG